MDLSYLDKFYLEEDTRINILANLVIKNVKNKLNFDSLKYVNHFNTNKTVYPKDIVIYLFFLNVIYDYNCMILDTEPLLNGQILDNEYNNLISQDSIILLYMKAKLYCARELHKICPRDIDVGNQHIMSQIEKYENFFNTQDSELLDKDIDEDTKTKLLMHEYNKTKLVKISVSIIISYYFFIFQKDKIKEFEIFICKVEDLTQDYIDKNLNMNISHFSEYLISNI